MNVANWFGLDMDSLAHLFLPGHWLYDLGGIPLNENSTPSDLAHNIYEFIQCRDPDYDYITNELVECKGKKKKTKVIKLQNEFYERNDEDVMPRMRA